MALDRLTIITSSGLSTVSDYVIDGLRAVGVVTASTVQVGAATTVHTTGVDLGSGNITSHNINSTGIITATGVTVTGDLTVEGTLAYDDVTNIDSVGVVTARSGIDIGVSGSGNNTFIDNLTNGHLNIINSGRSANNGRVRINKTNSASGDTTYFRDFEVYDGKDNLLLLADGSSGNIGIGTDNPITKFVVNSGNTNLATQIVSDDAEVFLAFKDGNSTGNQQVQIGGVGNNFVAYAGGNERLRITSAGNIGIGENNPAAKLDVKDSLSNTVDIRLRNTESNAQMSLYAFGGSAAIGSHFNNRIAMMSWNSTEGIDIITNGTANNDFRVYTAGYGTNSERFRITSDGKVGVGENSPDRLLHIKGASSTAYIGGSDTADYNFLKIENTTNDKSAGVFFQIGGNGEAAITATEVVDGNTDIAFQNRGGGVRSEKLRITSAGDMGLGTATPTSFGPTFQVAGADPALLLQDTATAVDYFGINVQSGAVINWFDDSAYFAIGTASGLSGSSYTERLRINSAGRVSIGGVTTPLGALHIEANQGTDTALWIGDNSSSRYLAINEQSSSSSFNHVITRFNDNAIHAHYILDNPYAQGTGYGSQILFRGNNQGTTAYIETSNEASGSARGTLRLRGADNHGLDVRSTGEVTTTHASNIGYATNAATNTRGLVYTSLDPQKRSTTAAEWYILKTFYPNKSGTVNMHAQMYITSGTYYFTFRVREEGTDEIVFNAGDNGGYGAYATNGNAVHSYKQYKWICPKIKAHKRYYIEMAGSNSAGTSINFNSSQQLFLKDFYVYSMSGGHSDSTGAMLIQQGIDESASTSYGGTTRAAMSGSVNRDSLNQVQYFAGSESTFLGWFTTRAYNRYLDFELNMNGSYMWFAQAYGYLYSRGQVAGSMISGYTYTNNTILNKYSLTLGNRGWYGSYRTSGGNLCLKFDSGGNGYSEGRIALFIGTHGVANKDWRVLRYRQNDTTSNIF